MILLNLEYSIDPKFKLVNKRIDIESHTVKQNHKNHFLIPFHLCPHYILYMRSNINTTQTLLFIVQQLQLQEGQNIQALCCSAKFAKAEPSSQPLSISLRDLVKGSLHPFPIPTCTASYNRMQNETMQMTRSPKNPGKATL